MKKYNYLLEVTNDVRNYIDAVIKYDQLNLKDYENRQKLESHLYNLLMDGDSVTGNASGSYFCNSYAAEEAIAHNWDILKDAIEEFGYTDANVIAKGAEFCDVIIRCYLLPEAISIAINELKIF